MSIFVNQGLLVLTLDTGIDLSGASVLTIRYKDPKGVRGTFPGTLVSGTKMEYHFTNTDLSNSGTWYFQAYVEIASFKGYGNIVAQDVIKSL